MMKISTIALTLGLAYGEVQLMRFDQFANRRLDEEEERAEAMAELKEMKVAHREVKASCKETGDEAACAEQTRLEERMIAMSAKWREAPREQAEAPREETEEEQRERAMADLREMKNLHRETKAACKETGDEELCALQVELEEEMIALSAKWREPAREAPRELTEEEQRAQAMDQLKEMKATHKEVKAFCKETFDEDACAEQAKLEEEMIALSAKWREPARNQEPTEEELRAKAMADLKEMKNTHREVKALCKETGDEEACAEQATLEENMITLSAKWREPARNQGRRLEEAESDDESERAKAMEKLRRMKRHHKKAKAVCKETGNAKSCAKQVRLEAKMIALSSIWREPARN